MTVPRHVNALAKSRRKKALFRAKKLQRLIRQLPEKLSSTQNVQRQRSKTKKQNILKKQLPEKHKSVHMTLSAKQRSTVKSILHEQANAKSKYYINYLMVNWCLLTNCLEIRNFLHNYI